MAIDPRVYKEISEAVFGKNDYEPLVTFYDHAAYNEVLSKQSGRPRYTEQTYTLLKPTHPDLKVRDTVSHPTTQDEIDRYPEQWARYQAEKQDQRDFHPPLQAIPGMRISYFRELQALEIFDAKALAEYEGDLGEIDHLRELAKRIMEVAREARELREARENPVREEREPVRTSNDRREYEEIEAVGTGTIQPIGTRPQFTQAETQQEKGEQEKGEQEKGYETFNYSFKVI